MRELLEEKKVKEKKGDTIWEWMIWERDHKGREWVIKVGQSREDEYKCQAASVLLPGNLLCRHLVGGFKGS